MSTVTREAIIPLYYNGNICTICGQTVAEADRLDHLTRHVEEGKVFRDRKTWPCEKGAAKSGEPVEVFDGCSSCLVPYCCEGKVIQVQVFEAPAFKNMVGAPLLTKQGFICKACRTELPYVRKPERVRKRLSIS
jgi:hypothetical protein